MRCHRPRLAPYMQFAATPSHGTYPEANRAGELLIGYEPVDRGSAQTRQLHDGGHAQEHRRYLGLCIGRLGGSLLHDILPVKVCE